MAKADDLKDNSITSLKWKPSVEGKSKILITADAYQPAYSEEEW